MENSNEHITIGKLKACFIYQMEGVISIPVWGPKGFFHGCLSDLGQVFAFELKVKKVL